MFDEERPVYTIGTAAELLEVHPRTLRLYEDGGLLRPARKNNRRFYSANDLKWIRCLRYLIHEKGLNQEGLRRLLALIPCYDIKGCPPEARLACMAHLDRTSPCWEHARRTDGDSRECHSCEVYLSAANHLLGQAELDAAVSYSPID